MFIGKIDEIVFCFVNNFYKVVGWFNFVFCFFNLNKIKYKKNLKNYNKGVWVLGVIFFYILCCN